jgi:hypothetical protein
VTSFGLPARLRGRGQHKPKRSVWLLPTEKRPRSPCTCSGEKLVESSFPSFPTSSRNVLWRWTCRFMKFTRNATAQYLSQSERKKKRIAPHPPSSLAPHPPSSLAPHPVRARRCSSVAPDAVPPSPPYPSRRPQILAAGGRSPPAPSSTPKLQGRPSSSKTDPRAPRSAVELQDFVRLPPGQIVSTPTISFKLA